MGRIDILDGLRGWCLVFMMITHLHINGDFLLGYLHFNQLIFADSAQAFIFLSGLLVGLVGVKQHRRDGIMPMTRRYWGRALELYGWHLGLVVAVHDTRLADPRRLVRLAGLAAAPAGRRATPMPGRPRPCSTSPLISTSCHSTSSTCWPLRLPSIWLASGRAGLLLAGSIGLWFIAQLGLERRWWPGWGTAFASPGSMSRCGRLSTRWPGSCCS